MKRVLIGLIVGIMIGTASTAIAANSDTVQAVFAKFNLKINDQEIIEIEPLAYRGTTYLPVREISNMLGYDVTWKADSRTIVLTMDAPETEQTIPEPQQIDKEVNNVIQTDQWISLRELAASGIDVTVGPEHNVMTITNGETAIKILTTDIVENETAEVTLLEPEGTIMLKSEDGQTHLEIGQLRSYGILN